MSWRSARTICNSRVTISRSAGTLSRRRRMISRNAKTVPWRAKIIPKRWRFISNSSTAMKTLFWDSINPATGRPYTWDDPNLRWGDPSYILEPGDPGYTPVPLPPNQPPPKSKKMKRQAYYPTSAAEQLVWLENFRNKLPGYQTAIPLTTAQSDAGVADARSVIYVIGSWLPGVRDWAKSCTNAAAQAQSGDGSTAIALPVFTAPALPTGVVLGNNGALDRLFALIQTIKDSSGYTEAIGLDLGIVGSAQAAPDFSILQPVITVTINGTTVDIGWGWGGFSAYLDQLEIQVDRGSGWTLLTIDTTPGYTDTTAHPATLTKWKYRAIYRVGDHQVGLWSAEVSVTVGG